MGWDFGIGTQEWSASKRNIQTEQAPKSSYSLFIGRSLLCGKHICTDLQQIVSASDGPLIRCPQSIY